MNKMMQRFCAMVMLPFMLVLNCPISALGAAAPEIEIDHDPVEEVTAGQRISLEAEIEDESGVEVVRVYFKAAEAAAYSFVVLLAVGGDTYTGILPAPANGVGSIEYLILVKNGNNQVVKTQTYQVAVEDDDDAAAAIANNDKISVYTELEQMPAEISGFSDNIAIDVVESAAKLGVVAGLYSIATAGKSTSGAVSGGTVTASSGMSTPGVVLTSVLVLAAVGGGVAAGVAAAEDDEADELNSQTILGSWNVNENDKTFIVTFYENGRYDLGGSSPGSWSLVGSTLTMIQDYTGDVWAGTVSGDATAFTMTGPTTAYFSR